MANPITWQNVNGPSVAEAARPMAMAQLSLDNAFNKFGGIVKDYEKVDEANWQQQKVNNKAEYLNKIAGFKNEEELRAAEKAGVLQQMMQGYGAQINADDVRGAVGKQIDVFPNRWKSDTAHQTAQTTQEQLPLSRQIGVDIALGNTSQAQQRIQNNPDLLNAVALAQDAAKVNQATKTEDRTQAKHESDLSGQTITQDTNALKLKEDRRIAADAGQLRADTERGNVLAAEAAQQREREQADYVKAFQGIGGKLTRTGSIDTNTITKEQVAELDRVGNLLGYTPYSQIMQGDLEKSGVAKKLIEEVGPTRGLKVVAPAYATYDAVTATTPEAIGNARVEALEAKVIEDEKNRGVPDFNTVAPADINAEILKPYLGHIDEKKQHLLIEGISANIRKGYKDKDGNFKNYPIGVIKTAVGEAINGWKYNPVNNYQDYVKEFMDKGMENPENIKRMAEAEARYSKNLAKPIGKPAPSPAAVSQQLVKEVAAPAPPTPQPMTLDEALRNRYMNGGY